MEINDEHKALLASLGISEEDFERFDGKWVNFEVDKDRGVRIYDPYYRTSYSEYIGIDGWSAWSSEKDTFMSDMIKAAGGSLAGSDASGNRSAAEEVSDALKKKFSPSKDGKVS
jgi:hypothetical protein